MDDNKAWCKRGISDDVVLKSQNTSSELNFYIHTVYQVTNVFLPIFYLTEAFNLKVHYFLPTSEANSCKTCSNCSLFKPEVKNNHAFAFVLFIFVAVLGNVIC